MNATSGGTRGRPPGLPKTGGRALGTPNRSTAALQEKLAALGCDPMAEMVKIAKDPTTEIGCKVNIFSTLMRYTVPIPKPVGDSGADQSTVGDESESAFTMAELIKWALRTRSFRVERNHRGSSLEIGNGGADDFSRPGDFS